MQRDAAGGQRVNISGTAPSHLPSGFVFTAGAMAWPFAETLILSLNVSAESFWQFPSDFSGLGGMEQLKKKKKKLCLFFFFVDQPQKWASPLVESLISIIIFFL